MGAGCSLKRQYRIKYSIFQTMLRQLRRAGGQGTYKDMEINGTLNGHTLRSYFTATSYASNGECCAWLVIWLDGEIVAGVKITPNKTWLEVLEDLKK